MFSLRKWSKDDSYSINIIDNPTQYSSIIGKWFHECYSRPPWNEGFYVCPVCCPADDPSSALDKSNQYFEEDHICSEHHASVQLFWSGERIEQYLSSLIKKHNNEFIFVGLLKDCALCGFIWGFPKEVLGKTGLYLDFIFVEKGLRRKPGIFSGIVSLLFVLRHRVFRSISIIRKMFDSLLDIFWSPSSVLMSYFMRVAAERKYLSLFTRILTHSKSVDYITWCSGLNRILQDNVDSRRWLYSRDLDDFFS